VEATGADGGGSGDAGCEMRVELESRELWSKFDAHCTEMVITKSGRYAVSIFILFGFAEHHAAEKP